MDKYQKETYGERIAGIYDELYAVYEPAAVETLGQLAGKGPALELGIGTGRIALPMSQQGVEMVGIDASPSMVEKLRSKPGGDQIPVTLGDFADVPVEGEFPLIYIMFNTIFALLTQEAQIRCFQNVARHLTTEGAFVLEAFVPDLTRFTRGQNLQVLNISENELRFDASQHDPVNQQVIAQHVFLTEAGVRLYPVQLRYAWPSELDLMARLAGLRLRSRWGDWKGGEFTASSGKHISVYERD
jgi:ubiquinone/menaquinone biosynthesis C-methylase UbiE